MHDNQDAKVDKLDRLEQSLFQLSEVINKHQEMVQKRFKVSSIEIDILKLLDSMPVGYRTVFNLYVIEGYKHREIAEQLGISINTSKSQLILAKKRLREQLEKLGYTAPNH